jgi:hypothetical protein
METVDVCSDIARFVSLGTHDLPSSFANEWHVFIFNNHAGIQVR